MLFYFCFVFVIIYLVIIMDKLDFDFKVNDLDLKVNFQKAKEDKSFCKLINSLNLKEEILCKYTSMLKDSAEEINNCRHCKGLNDCKNSVVGSFLAPQNNNNGLVFSYIDCHYKSDSKYKENVSLFDMPLRLKDACISNIYTDDKSRIEIIKKMKCFSDNYLKGEKTKGIYLYGSFGVGKSYLIAALFNELAKKNIKSVILHVPELVRTIKESFEMGNYAEKFDLIKNVPLLLLDDIGAEYLTGWSRDEILEPILQYRMDQGLPVFFTSNYDLLQLEKHFVLNDDKVKAKRLIERIKQVSEPIELISQNMRS